jgi:hypothetical protein
MGHQHSLTPDGMEYFRNDGAWGGDKRSSTSYYYFPAGPERQWRDLASRRFDWMSIMSRLEEAKRKSRR